MKFGFVAKHRGTWPVDVLCEALGVSRSGFYAWRTRTPRFKWLKEENPEDSDELPEPEELITDAVAELEAAVEELQTVMGMLEGEDASAWKAPA